MYDMNHRNSFFRVGFAASFHFPPQVETNDVTPKPALRAAWMRKTRYRTLGVEADSLSNGYSCIAAPLKSLGGRSAFNSITFSRKERAQ